MKTRILCAALFVAACSTNQHRTAITIDKVLAAQASTAAGSTTPNCTVNPGGNESDFLNINPAENVGHVGLVLDNHLVAQTTINSTLQFPAVDFQAHQVVVNYEIVGQGSTIPQQVFPTTGVVLRGTVQAVGVVFFPGGVLPAGLKDGTFIRVSARVDGNLNDGSSTSSDEREYLFRVCNAAGCAGNPCI